MLIVPVSDSFSFTEIVLSLSFDSKIDFLRLARSLWVVFGSSSSRKQHKVSYIRYAYRHYVTQKFTWKRSWLLSWELIHLMSLFTYLKIYSLGYAAEFRNVDPIKSELVSFMFKLAFSILRIFFFKSEDTKHTNSGM